MMKMLMVAALIGLTVAGNVRAELLNLDDVEVYVGAGVGSLRHSNYNDAFGLFGWGDPSRRNAGTKAWAGVKLNDYVGAEVGSYTDDEEDGRATT